MGCAAGLEDERNGRVLGAEAMKLFSVESFTVDYMPAAIGAGELKDILCEVHGNERSIHNRTPPVLHSYSDEFNVALRC
jgi:hypothetical protein